MQPTAVVPRPKPPTTTVRMPLLTAPPLRGSPSCVSGVGTSFVDEMPSLGSLSLSSYWPLPQQSYPFDRSTECANREFAAIGVDGGERWKGSEEGNMGGDRRSMGQQNELGTEWHAPGSLPGMTEPPPSVAFVGPEPGTQQFVDAPHQYHHLHHHFSGSDQQYQFNDCHHSADYGWVGVEEQPYLPMDAHNAIVFGTAGPASSSSPPFQQNTVAFTGHHEQYLPIGQEHEEFQITDISSSTQFQYGPAVFDPLSVGTSASWSAGEGGHSSAEEALEYSSLSQDEILEEIQRECAEIECRSSSDSLPQQAKSSKKGNNKRAVAVKRTPSTMMKKKPYSGRGSVSSLDSPEVSPAPTAKRRERKKELNRVAATRYREKKRKEREQTSGDLQELEQRNAQLKADIAGGAGGNELLEGVGSRN
uniref:BZIP domain-containing protein n=1 Tax=Globodera rostochiensis TaxID=31243 RepID=A0A914HYX3_GLORO